MKKLLLSIMLLLILLSKSNAQDNENILKVPELEKDKNRLGFAGSMFSGYGLSFEKMLNDKHAHEITASIYGEGGDVSSYEGNYITFTLGSEYHRNLFVNHDSRFYSLFALSYWYSNSDNNSYFYSSNDRQTTNTKTNTYVIGTGLGWEYNITRKIIFNVEAGFLYRTATEKGNEYYYDNVSQKDFLRDFSRNKYSLGLGVGAGIYYSF